MDPRFVEIAEQAITKAEQVDCALSDFALGLRDIREAIDERLSQVESELRGSPLTDREQAQLATLERERSETDGR